MFICSSEGVDLLWRIELSDSSIKYSVETHNKSDGEYINRIMIYSACGRGGLWGDPGVEDATYSCRYYVDYGFESSRETFSSIMIPNTVREYRFEKHSYKSRFFQMPGG
jgi:hypothetical protein